LQIAKAKSPAPHFALHNFADCESIDSPPPGAGKPDSQAMSKKLAWN
jgi:hypothetical protein